MDNRTSNKFAGAAQTVADESLNTVETAMNTAIDSTKDAVHELRSEAVEAVNQTVDRTIGRVKDSLDQRRPQFEQYIASHPWIMLGGLLMLGYLLTGKRNFQP
ncbi:MAG: hypothetical protein H8K07_03235 [Nitrospira sp.]|jgi:ElaB/YqjD/DUF883 family membrane-anchored ribosome-binding protein|nr:hypothetical protein [Nitrospira sp.]MDI3463787.1 hypothetical protein [Nitrospira sp.]